MPVYNQEKYIAETIDSILGQSFGDFELLILDDGSTDNSADIIRQYSENDVRIKAYFEPNSGKSESTNKLVERAIGKWCAFLDADDVMMPNRLERQISFLNENPGVHAVSSDCFYINETGRIFGTQKYPLLSNKEAFDTIFKKGHFITCSFTALTVLKAAFQEVNGLAKRFEPCEDFEFFNKFIFNGGKVLLIIPEVLMKYRIHSNSVTVRKPMHVTNFISYTTHSMWLRRIGEPETSFEEYMKIQNSGSKLKRWNQTRFNYSMVYFRNAGISALSKQYHKFAWYFMVSFLLSPNYAVIKLVNYFKKQP